MSFGGERRESAHNRGGEKKQRKKGSRHRAYHQQFSTVGSWLSHRDLGGSGDPWWAGAAGLVPSWLSHFPGQRPLTRDTVPGVFLLCRVAPSVQTELPLTREKQGCWQLDPGLSGWCPK